MRKRGYEPGAIDAIDAPAGLYIGAKTPEEVALSGLAELVQRRRLNDHMEKTADDEQSQAS